MDQTENSLFDIPDYDQIDDERFAAFPPPASPGAEDDGGQTANGLEDWDGNREAPQEEPPPQPTKKAAKRNIPKLDADRLVSERGLPALRTMFADTKFKGKGHEVEDLKLLLRRMEHWAHRLYPKLGFEDFISKLEALGNKKPVQTCLKRIRLDMPIVHEDFTSEGAVLLEGQSNGVDAPADDFDTHLPSANADPFSQIVNVSADSPPPSQSNPFLNEETRLRIERNKQLALERRLAKIQSSSQNPDVPSTPAPTRVEDQGKKAQDVEKIGEDMDAEFLDVLVAAAAETEASVMDISGNALPIEEVDNDSPALASNDVHEAAASDANSMVDPPATEGLGTAVVKGALKTVPVDVAFEVAEMPEVKGPPDPHVPTVVASQDADLASSSTELQEEGADVRAASQDNPSMVNVETSADAESIGPGASVTTGALETPPDDPPAMKPYLGMVVTGIPQNRTAPESPNPPVEVTEAAV